MSLRREREEKVTKEQKEVILQFMEDHLDFARGKLLGLEGRKTWLHLWAQLTELLNHTEGPQKISTKWQRVWTDMKNKTKKKASEMKKSRSLTGGGPPTDTNWTDFDEKCLALLTHESVFGLQGPDGLSLESEEVAGPSAQAGPSAMIPAEQFAAVTGSFAIEEREMLNYEIVTTPCSSTFVDTTDDEHSETISRPRKRSKKAADSAYSVFVDQNNDMNNQLQQLNNKMDQLLESRNFTNIILSDIAGSLKLLCEKK